MSEKTLREHCTEIASKGGSSRSTRKLDAVRANLERARALKALYRRNPELRSIRDGDY
jgi:hypothetical protein